MVNSNLALYTINESRGSKVLEDILGREYKGIVSSNFYAAYNPIKALAKQRLLAHLLREIKKVEERNRFRKGGSDWKFLKWLKGAIRVWYECRERKRAISDLKDKKEQVLKRMVKILALTVEAKDSLRLQKRIIKHYDELFTFFDYP